MDKPLGEFFASYRNPEYQNRATSLGRGEDTFAAEEITLKAENLFSSLNDIAYKVARIALSPDSQAERQRQLEELVAEVRR